MAAHACSKVRCSPKISAATAPSLPACTSPPRQDDKGSKDSSGKLDKISKLDKAEEEPGHVDEKSAADSHDGGVKLGRGRGFSSQWQRREDKGGIGGKLRLKLPGLERSHANATATAHIMKRETTFRYSMTAEGTAPAVQWCR